MKEKLSRSTSSVEIARDMSVQSVQSSCKMMLLIQQDETESEVRVTAPKIKCSNKEMEIARHTVNILEAPSPSPSRNVKMDNLTGE